MLIQEGQLEEVQSLVLQQEVGMIPEDQQEELQQQEKDRQLHQEVGQEVQLGVLVRLLGI